MKHRMPLIAISAGLVVAGGLAMASPATASQSMVSPARTSTARTSTARTSTAVTGPSASDPYCTAEAVPAGTSQQGQPSVTCYATFSASIRAATKGRVQLAETVRPGTVTMTELNAPARSQAAAAATTYVLSIDFQNANYGGVSLAWYQSAKCGAFYASGMPSGWNDTVSSLIAYNGCATTLFKNASFAGATYAIEKNGSASTLASFNDEASSQTWCTAYPCGS